MAIDRSTVDVSLNNKERSLSGLRLKEEVRDTSTKLDTSTFLPLRSRKPVAAPVVA